MLIFVFVYLANTAVLCYSLTIICCCQVQDYIYWILSTENDHRHHHKFIKYEKPLRKEGKKHARLTYQAQSLPLQREFGRVALPWVRSNGPTDPLHISCICSIWKILHFYSSFSLNPSKSAFFNALTLSLFPKNHMLFIVSKQCACSRRVHNRRSWIDLNSCYPDNNSNNDSFGSFLSKIRIFCSITRC